MKSPAPRAVGALAWLAGREVGAQALEEAVAALEVLYATALRLEPHAGSGGFYVVPRFPA